MPDDRPRPRVVARTAAVATRPPRSGPLLLRFGAPGTLSDELFAGLAAANADLRLERTADGDLEIMAPAGSDSSHRNFELNGQLYLWTRGAGAGLGVAFDSSGGFTLAGGAIRSPDFAWISGARWDALDEAQKKTCARICPDFVVELRSPTDRLGPLRKKLREFVAMGARLGWLIDPIRGRVEIFRPGRPAEVLERPATLSGEDVLPGLVVEMKGILGD